MRETILSPTIGEVPLSYFLNIIRDERHKVTLTGHTNSPLAFTVAANHSNATIIELLGTGSITISKEVMSVLQGGMIYPFNIWLNPGPEQILLVNGQLRMLQSILPSGDSSSALAFLPRLTEAGGPSKFVMLSYEDYNSLPSYDPDTLYAIVDQI